MTLPEPPAADTAPTRPARMLMFDGPNGVRVQCLACDRPVVVEADMPPPYDRRDRSVIDNLIGWHARGVHGVEHMPLVHRMLSGDAETVIGFGRDAGWYAAADFSDDGCTSEVSLTAVTSAFGGVTITFTFGPDEGIPAQRFTGARVLAEGPGVAARLFADCATFPAARAELAHFLGSHWLAAAPRHPGDTALSAWLQTHPLAPPVVA